MSIRSSFHPFEPSLFTKIVSTSFNSSALIAYSTLGLLTLSGLSWPFSLLCAGSAYLCQKTFVRIISGGDILRSATFLSAEHLSKLTVEGGLPILTLPPIIKILNNIGSEDAILAKNYLEGIYNYENNFDYLGLRNAPLINDLIQKIGQLWPKEKVCIPLSYMNPKGGGHILMGSIERQEDEHFILRVHNGGEGIEYHYKKIDRESGNTIYQTTLEIENIKLDDLKVFIKKVSNLHAFGLTHDIQKVYQSLTFLKGKIKPPSQDPRLWSREQLGNSCSGFSIKCLLQFLLTEKTFKLFDHQFLLHSAIELKKGLEKGYFWENTTEHAMVYQELRGKLLRIDGTDIGPIENKGFSLLSQLSSKTQQLFWKTFFPLDFSRAFSLGGLSVDEYGRIGSHPDFENLEIASKKIPIFSTPSKIDIENFKEVYLRFYNLIDPTKLSSQEMDEINLYTKRILKREDITSCKDIAVKILYKFLFLQFNYKILDQNAFNLMSIIELIKEKKLEIARNKLNELYENIFDLDTITFEQSKEYDIVMTYTSMVSI